MVSEIIIKLGRQSEFCRLWLSIWDDFYMGMDFGFFTRDAWKFRTYSEFPI